jgi:signal transduction histidine kinase
MESRERLRELACHLQDVREEQRSRIAREIHDELGQALTALKMDVHWLGRRLPESASELLDKIEAMSNLIGGTVQSVRRICSELRPGILDDFGLVAAIEWQAEEFAKRTGIPCQISAAPAEILLNRDLATAVFRIFQEALTNIVRHAEASRVDVGLKAKGGRFEMSVCDDGAGMQPEPFERGKSFGLIGIRERVRDFGGELFVSEASAGGTFSATSSGSSCDASSFTSPATSSASAFKGSSFASSVTSSASACKVSSGVFSGFSCTSSAATVSGFATVACSATLSTTTSSGGPCALTRLINVFTVRVGCAPFLTQ